MTNYTNYEVSHRVIFSNRQSMLIL